MHLIILCMKRQGFLTTRRRLVVVHGPPLLLLVPLNQPFIIVGGFSTGSWKRLHRSITGRLFLVGHVGRSETENTPATVAKQPCNLCTFNFINECKLMKHWSLGDAGQMTVFEILNCSKWASQPSNWWHQLKCNFFSSSWYWCWIGCWCCFKCISIRFLYCFFYDTKIDKKIFIRSVHDATFKFGWLALCLPLLYFVSWLASWLDSSWAGWPASMQHRITM